MIQCSFCQAFIVCLLLVSHFAQSQLQKIYLHPKAAGNEKQSKIVDSIRLIPLESIEGFQLKKYNDVRVTKNHFLINDYTDKAIWLWSKNGKFTKKISYKNLGERFFPDYDEYSNRVVFVGNNKNYQLTSKDQLKILLDWNNPRNKKYFRKYVIDLNDTSLTIRKDLPQQNDILHASHYYDDLYYLGRITTSKLFKDSMDYEFKIYRNNQLLKGFFPYNHITETRFLYTDERALTHETETPNVHFITRPYCDTIYKMIGDSSFPAYQLVLPLENSLPASFFTTSFKNKTERENFNRNNGWLFHQIFTFHETPRLIHLIIGYLSNYDSYIYLKQTNTTYKIKNVKPDSSQYNLQLLEEFGLSIRGDRFYKPQKAGNLLTFFEHNKNVPVPKELESFLKSKPDAETPVVIEFKLKN